MIMMGDLQVIGSILAVGTIREAFPEVGHGPRLNVDVHHGALTEGALTFVIVMISLGLKQKDPKSFFMKTWMSSIAKLTLHILGSDLTGGCMNPASVSFLLHSLTSFWLCLVLPLNFFLMRSALLYWVKIIDTDQLFTSKYRKKNGAEVQS